MLRITKNFAWIGLFNCSIGVNGVCISGLVLYKHVLLFDEIQESLQTFTLCKCFCLWLFPSPSLSVSFPLCLHFAFKFTVSSLLIVVAWFKISECSQFPNETRFVHITRKICNKFQSVSEDSTRSGFGRCMCWKICEFTSGSIAA